MGLTTLFFLQRVCSRRAAGWGPKVGGEGGGEEAAEVVGLDLEEQERQAARLSQVKPILEWDRPTATHFNAPGKLGVRGVPQCPVVGPVPRSHSWGEAAKWEQPMGPGREALSGIEPEGAEPGPDLWPKKPFAVSPFGPRHSVITGER